MQIAVEVGGFTMGEADVLRKAMGKKKPEVMAEQKEKFIEGAASRGVEKRKARELWEYIEPFAGYGFNKSHSVAYAMLAYKTAYLKSHHPVAFMTAMLTSEMSSKDNVAKYFQECRDMGIMVLPPDVNESAWSFAAVGDSIRFGIGCRQGDRDLRRWSRSSRLGDESGALRTCSIFPPRLIFGPSTTKRSSASSRPAVLTRFDTSARLSTPRSIES